MAKKSAVHVNGYAAGAKEYLLSGRPLTRLEALIFFGLSNLTDLIHEMRQAKFIIKSKKVSYATVMVRINDNEYAVLKPPANLPIREIMFTEYWVSK
jgi:hypothetical protein